VEPRESATAQDDGVAGEAKKMAGHG